MPEKGVDMFQEVHAFGWLREQYEQLPKELRDHIGACRAFRDRERDPKKQENRLLYCEAREGLESDIPFTPEILSELDQARERMVSVASQYLSTLLPGDVVAAILAANGMDTIASDVRACEEIRMKVVEEAVTEVRVALVEAFANHIKHGLQGDPQGVISGNARVVNGVAIFYTKDSGLGFDVKHVADPTKNLYKPSGRGLVYMNLYMNHFEIRENGTAYVMWRNLLHDPRRKPWDVLVKSAAQEYLEAQQDMEQERG